MGIGNGITADQAVKAITGSKGFVTVIAKRLNVSPRHVYRVIDKYATAQEALETEREGMKDFAEGKLFEKINAGDTTALIFYLKTQAKDRGYVERQEVAGAGKDGAIIIRVEGGLSDDSN